MGDSDSKTLVISYLTLRKVLGLIAMALPLLLIAGSVSVQTSLSANWHTTARDIFTTGLVAFGIFLLCYRGYDENDRLLTGAAGVAVIMVAFFPCNQGIDSYLFQFLSPFWNGVIHTVSAFIAFGSMGVMSKFQFTKSAGERTSNKDKRDIIFNICGDVIFICLALCIIVSIPVIRNFTDKFRLFFILETLIVESFGISWLVKGQAILSD